MRRNRKSSTVTLPLSDRITSAQSHGVHDATHLIWPESAFPFFLAREPDALAEIAQLLHGGTVLITGAVRLAEPVNPADPAAYNSIYVIDPDGSIVSLYDKVHLVPFGEYLPFQNFLESLGLQQLTKQRGGFLAGDRHRLIAVPGAPMALPLICYEIIFPGEVTPKGDRPGWIVNVTNDGWFGISTGTVSALPSGAGAGHRRRLAVGARGQYRHFRRHRSAWKNRQVARARQRRSD